MKLFTCDGCGTLVYFENTRCLSCNRRLGFSSTDRDILALEGEAEPWLPTRGGTAVRLCANAAFDACNWLIADDDDDAYCRCCRHNRTVPDLGKQQNVLLWRRIELAKHRLIDGLMALGLPLPTKAEDEAVGLAFDFLDADAPAPEGGRVMTGHADGVVTLALHEADDAIREKIRTEMGEPYRSLLGHLRHEIGHYYFDRLVQVDPAVLEAARGLFGDDRADYAEALRRHYAEGAPADWNERHVSAYATAHPWEDFAETFAHYLHIVDTLETAHAFGLSVRPRVPGGGGVSARADVDPTEVEGIEALIARWLPLTYAVNSLNRSMGQPDLYPFVLAPPVIDKLGFIHGLVRTAGRKTDA
jgi:hypothetical protein